MFLVVENDTFEKPSNYDAKNCCIKSLKKEYRFEAKKQKAAGNQI